MNGDQSRLQSHLLFGQMPHRPLSHRHQKTRQMAHMQTLESLHCKLWWKSLEIPMWIKCKKWVYDSLYQLFIMFLDGREIKLGIGSCPIVASLRWECSSHHTEKRKVMGVEELSSSSSYRVWSVNQVGSSAEESKPPDTASKKRAASHQISKDDDLDLEDVVAVKSGTFRKASDAVLANWRIVKVWRTGTTMGGGGVGGGRGRGTAAPNPFASIRLVPAVASASDEGVAPQPQPVPGLTSDPLETIVALEKGDGTEVRVKESDQPPTDANPRGKKWCSSHWSVGWGEVRVRPWRAVKSFGQDRGEWQGKRWKCCWAGQFKFWIIPAAFFCKKCFFWLVWDWILLINFHIQEHTDINRLFFFWFLLLVRVRVCNRISGFDKLDDSSYGIPISLQCVWQRKWQHDLVPAFWISSCRNCHSRVRGPKYGRATPPRSSFTNGGRERKTSFCSWCLALWVSWQWMEGAWEGWDMSEFAWRQRQKAKIGHEIQREFMATLEC